MRMEERGDISARFHINCDVIPILSAGTVFA